MSEQVFVTGMIRSGTTLTQVLLTNHPEAFVVYQPFHQLYVDVKRRFLDERGTPRALPLGDGMGEDPTEAQAFREWLAARMFSDDEARDLTASAVTGKGGSLGDLGLPLQPRPGTFFELRSSLLAQVAAHFGAGQARVIGSKEVLCEEYLPALLDAGSHAVAVVRDPRGVVASANLGSYRDLVGDRYPLLMLVRLWRKSARHALACADHERGLLVRYEDLAGQPAAVTAGLASALGLAPYPDEVLGGPLLDHAGVPWHGNSSFGDRTRVDASGATRWHELLDPAVALFVEACTRRELEALGYATDLTETEARAILADYVEDETDVRASYLELYRLTPERREQEMARTHMEGI